MNVMAPSGSLKFLLVVLVLWVCVVGTLPSARAMPEDVAAASQGNTRAGAGQLPPFDNDRSGRVRSSETKRSPSRNEGTAPTCPQAAIRLAREEFRAWQLQLSNVQQPFTVTNGCLVVVTAGYWHLEICPSRWIRQFSVQDNRVVQENFLGFQRHWETGSAAAEPQVAYADGSRSSIPERIRGSDSVLKGAPLEEAFQSTPYNCSVSEHGVMQITAEYAGGNYCASHHTFRSSRLRLVCDMEKRHTVMLVSEPKPCRYDIVMASRFLCGLMGADITEGDVLARRREIDDSGHQFWRSLEDSDMLFSL